MNSPKPLALAGSDQDDMGFSRVLCDEPQRRKARCTIVPDGEPRLDVFYQIIGNFLLAHTSAYFISVSDGLINLAPNGLIVYLIKPISRAQLDVASCLTK